MNTQLIVIPLEDEIDKHIGKVGTLRRDRFENELKLELLDYAVKAEKNCRNKKRHGKSGT